LAPDGKKTQRYVKTIPWNPHSAARVTVRGRFLFVVGEKFWVRGVTYGTFRADAAGREYPTGPRLERDFAAIAANGFNTIRTYTVPPRDVLDTAWRHGLRCLIGMPWEQHVAFLDDPERAASIVARVRAGVRACAGHPAVFAYAVGNEIPAPIVRWHGREAIERFLATLVDVVRAEDPDALVTYVRCCSPKSGSTAGATARPDRRARSSGSSARRSAVVRAGRSCSRGRTNGTAAGSTSTIGISGSPTANDVRSRHWRR
jgi:hypothetical protein